MFRFMFKINLDAKKEEFMNDVYGCTIVALQMCPIGVTS